MLPKGRNVLESVRRIPFGISRTELLEFQHREGEKLRIQKKKNLIQKFENLETVEEKMIGLNMPRYYGFKGLSMMEHQIPYNVLPTIQNLTKTHVVSNTFLPQIYDFFMDDVMPDTFPSLRNAVEDILLFEHEHRLRDKQLTNEIKENRCALENFLANAVIHQINRILLAYLSANVKSLAECQIDYEPRVEAFWYITGVEPPRYIRKCKQLFPSKEYERGYDYELPVHYMGSPVLQLRHRLPLDPVLSFEDVCKEKEEYTVPEQPSCPIAAGYPLERKHATIIPGFWPGDRSQFSLLSYHNRGHLLLKSPRNDFNEALMAQAILASYSWLLGQACYQGFTPFNDLTYPLITQTVITNGQYWSFGVYQLNTIALQQKYYMSNDRVNLLWMTEPMKLYDSITDNKVNGFNEEVLMTLFRMYLNTPAARAGVNMSPYLGEAVKYVADIDDPERRQWLEQHYKHLMSNRPRHRRVPEIPDWQRIYIFGPRQMPERLRDPWQKGINPMKRQLNQHAPRYVPKALRINPKWKKVGRFAKSYYPEV